MHIRVIHNRGKKPIDHDSLTLHKDDELHITSKDTKLEVWLYPTLIVVNVGDDQLSAIVPPVEVRRQ